MSNRIHGVRTVIGLATLVVAFGASAQAQTQTQATFDTRWQAWFGCWQPSDASGLTGAKPAALCIAPLSSKSAVEVSMVQDGAVTTRDTIDASGVAHTVDKQGCKGTETGNWSADNRRVFLHSALTCEGGLARSGNAIIALTPTGDWVNIQTLTVGASTGVRTVRYRDANALNVAPPAVAEVVKDRQLAINAARADAGMPLDINGVREAVQRTDTAAVQSWIVERGTRFNLDARQLVALADAGIPGSVTDVMIGVSYPDHFALKPAQGSSALGGVSSAMDVAGGCSAAAVSMYGRAGCSPCRSGWDYDPFFFSGYSDCGLGYRYGYSPYSLYSPYYSPYGYGYGYGAYSPYYGYSSAPVVVVKGEEQKHGRVVNGRGYTQGGGSTGRSSDPFPASSSASRGSSSSSGGSSGGSSAGSSGGAGGSSSSGSSSGGEPRTAHPRPPM